MATSEFDQYEVKSEDSSLDEFAQYEKKNPAQDMHRTPQYLLDSAKENILKPLAVGTVEMGRGLINLPADLLRLVVPEKYTPRPYEIDYQKTLGVSPEQRSRPLSQLAEAVPQLVSSAFLPAAKVPALEAALTSQLPRVGKYLSSAIANALPQGLFAAATSPDQRTETGTTAAALTAPFSAAARAVSEGSPLTRILAKGALIGGSGALTYEGAKGMHFGTPAAGTAGLISALLAAKGIRSFSKYHEPLEAKTQSALEPQQQFEPTREELSQSLKEEPSAISEVSKEPVMQQEPEVPQEVFQEPVKETQIQQSKEPEKPVPYIPEVNNAATNLGIAEPGENVLLKKQTERLPLEQRAINELYQNINKSPENAAKRTRLAAKKAIKSAEQERSEAASPHYEAAANDEVPEDLVNSLIESNEYIKKAVNKVEKSPEASTEGKLKGVPVNSIKVLQKAKINLDDQISTAKSQEDNALVRSLMDSKNELVRLMNKSSPAYSKANGIFEQESAKVNELKEGLVGKIAKLKNTQLKNVPDIIFDPKHMDMEEFRTLKNEVRNQDPEAWSGITRNKIQGTMAKETEENAMNFFKNILANRGMYNKYHAALEENPEALQHLSDMQTAFPHLRPDKAERPIKQGVPQEEIERIRNEKEAQRIAKSLQRTKEMQLRRDKIQAEMKARREKTQAELQSRREQRQTEIRERRAQAETERREKQALIEASKPPEKTKDQIWLENQLSPAYWKDQFIQELLNTKKDIFNPEVSQREKNAAKIIEAFGKMNAQKKARENREANK